MKKLYNKKQEEYSANKVETAKRNTMLRMIFAFGFLFVLIVAGMAITNPETFDFETAIGIGGSGTVVATMAAIGNIDAVTDRYTMPNQIKYKVWLIHVSQIDDNQAYPAPNANREVGTIPLLAGEVIHYLEAIDDTVRDNSTGEKGDITTEFANMLEFTMGGDGNKLYDFIEEFAGGRFVILYQKCSTGDYYIAGDSCKPMILKSFDRKRDSEATAVVFKFQNSSFKQPYKYVGAIPGTTAQVVAADAVNLAMVAGKYQYQLTDNAGATVFVSTSGITSARYGDTIEVLGSGGVNPATIADNAVFILIDGATWTGNTGSRISFRIQDDSTLVEIAGTRVQT